MKKDKLFLIIVVIMFIISVFLTILSFCFNTLSVKGVLNINESYLKIKLLNASINSDTSSYIKIDEKENMLIININEIDKELLFSTEILNIGNKEAYIDYEIINNDENIETNVVFNKNQILKLSDKKKVNITIKNNSNEKKENVIVKIKFNIKENKNF